MIANTTSVSAAPANPKHSETHHSVPVIMFAAAVRIMTHSNTSQRFLRALRAASTDKPLGGHQGAVGDPGNRIELMMMPSRNESASSSTIKSSRRPSAELRKNAVRLSRRMCTSNML